MSTPYWSDSSVTLWHGDCLDVLRILPDASVDAIVTDPPYGIRFMGQAWDGADIEEIVQRGRETSPMPEGVGGPRGGYRSLAAEAGRYDRGLTANQAFQQWCTDWSAECLRVLKPGGHLLAFGGTRTWHRLACAVEDAGFEIRDSIAWLYGSGFPKSLNVERSVDTFLCVLPGRHRWTPQACTLPEDHVCPSTAEGRAHAGDGTALKPAYEPVVVGRKPLIGTVAANVLAHGTGALNIDGCRVATNSEVVSTPQSNPDNREPSSYAVLTDRERFQQIQRESIERTNTLGRWPTNVILDESQAAELDRQSEVQRDGFHVGRNRDASLETGGYSGGWNKDASDGGYGGSGGASRFFPTFHYEAKAPTSERPTYVQEGAGTGRVTGLGGKVRQCNVCETRAIESGATEPSCGHGDFRWEEPTTDTRSRIAHPTVKPLDLMRWLVRLVTPPGGLVLDPFAGSGTTAEACVVEGFRCVLIEREADYLPLIVQRLTKPIAPVLDFGASA